MKDKDSQLLAEAYNKIRTIGKSDKAWNSWLIGKGFKLMDQNQIKGLVYELQTNDNHQVRVVSNVDGDDHLHLYYFSYPQYILDWDLYLKMSIPEEIIVNAIETAIGDSQSDSSPLSKQTMTAIRHPK